ncbi:MAG: O-antigen ligase family protein [Cellulosilyticaceae bacterium]
MLSILLTCCIHPGYRHRYRVSYYFTLVVCVFSLPIFLIADSRASWIALLVAVSRSIYVYCLQSKNRFSLFFSRFKSVAFLLVVISFYGLYQLKPDSAQGRLLIWKVTLSMINEKPLTGFGPEGFATYYMHYQAAYLETSATLRESYLADSNHIVSLLSTKNGLVNN